MKARLDKIPTLKPAFKKDGTIRSARVQQGKCGIAGL
jgi:hypothetical protein